MQHDIIQAHNFTALETIPLAELETRRARVREHLARIAPEASGLLVFSRLNIYYLTGTMAAGVLWLPLHGQPVLLARKGLARASLESPQLLCKSFKSYKELPKLLIEANQPLGRIAAVEMDGLSWGMAEMFKSRVNQVDFVPGDQALTGARAIKTPWELEKVRLAGRKHQQALEQIIPTLIKPGMTENELFQIVSKTYLELGHGGAMRMCGSGEEVFFGHLACGDSGNYPTYYNGPMGFRGIHPAQPCLGSQKVWTTNSVLTVDLAFNYQGYLTDKTQTYWAGTPDSLPPEALAAYSACQAVLEQAEQNLRPGALPSEIWRQTLALIAETPFAAGFMGLWDNQVPFLGHGIGLCIDEEPVIARGFDQPLTAGMVLALEPKIGLPGFGMVGIENTYEITDSGCVCLTAASRDMIFVV